jgi:hypothetical protein
VTGEQHADTVRRALSHPFIDAVDRGRIARATDELDAEIQRLRDALERIADEANISGVSRHIARAALRGGDAT